MPQEEQSEWPSFETVLREVAPDSPSIRDRKPGSSPAPAKPSKANTPKPEAAVSGTATSDTMGTESGEAVETLESADIPELSEPLDLDTSSIRELLRKRTSASSFGATADLTALEPLPEVLDLDNPAPGDLIDDGYKIDADETTNPSVAQEPPAPTPSDIEAAPAPPILATPPTTQPDVPPSPAETPEIAVGDSDQSELPSPGAVQEAQSFSFEQSEDFNPLDINQPLNPFDPAFEGIAEEVVEDDDGWITHSLHNIGVPDVATDAPDELESPQPNPPLTVAPGVEATEPEAAFDPLARMTSSSPFDPLEAPELKADLQPQLETEPSVSNNPFADLLPDATAPTFDASGLFDTGSTDTSAAQAEVEQVEATHGYVETVDPSGLQEPIVFEDEIPFEEVPEPPAPADQLIDFEQYRPTSKNASEPLGSWNQLHEAEVIPFTPNSFSDAPPPPPPPAPDASDEGLSAENLFHIDDFAEDEAEQPELPQTNWVSLDDDAPPPPPAPTRSPKSEDPWAEMRPNEVPEKISFWESRPKFFGGDERRKARARREAKKVLEESGTPIPHAHSCPNCGGPCRVDVEDLSTGRTHISCNICSHMWVDDAENH